MSPFTAKTGRVSFARSPLPHTAKEPRLVAKVATQNDPPVYIRVQIQVTPRHRQTPILSRLASDYGLSVNILKAQVEGDRASNGAIEIELRGSTAQIEAGLAYLTSFGLQISGKPNPDGDGWHY